MKAEIEKVKIKRRIKVEKCGVKKGSKTVIKEGRAIKNLMVDGKIRWVMGIFLKQLVMFAHHS